MREQINLLFEKFKRWFPHWLEQLLLVLSSKAEHLSLFLKDINLFSRRTCCRYETHVQVSVYMLQISPNKFPDSNRILMKSIALKFDFDYNFNSFHVEP